MHWNIWIRRSRQWRISFFLPFSESESLIRVKTGMTLVWREWFSIDRGRPTTIVVNHDHYSRTTTRDQSLSLDFNGSMEGFHGNIYCRQFYDLLPPNPSQFTPRLPPISIWWILWISTTRNIVTVDTLPLEMWLLQALGLGMSVTIDIIFIVGFLSCFDIGFVAFFSLAPLMLNNNNI